MTAGQRNCYDAIEQCLNSYRWDDVLFAMREHLLTESASAPDSQTRAACDKAIARVDGMCSLLRDVPARWERPDN